MLETSHYDKEKADRAVAFITNLKHTKGKWAGKNFDLLPWQEQIIRDLFGVVKEDGKRQFLSAYIEIPKKNGKEVALDTLIPTPTGFITMGKIKVGDLVFDENGNVCRVVAKSKIDFEEQAYRITFKDGEVIEAGENHQWYGEYTHGKRKNMIMTTDELYKMPKDNGSFRFRIKVAQAIQTPDTKLPIDPYLMGYWLGNGNATEPVITVKTGDIPEVLALIQPCHFVERAWSNVGDSVKFKIPDLKAVLVDSFHDKKIPNIYLRASYYQRLELLKGLMDSDGCINPLKGQAIYTSTEKALSESVSELLWSLGIKNSITTAISTQRCDWSKPSRKCGREPTGETLYYVKFTAFEDLRVCGLRRKYKNSVKRNPRTRSHYRYIDSIEPIKNNGMQCIQVDSPSHQYLVGRSFLPTHNSELAAAIALYLLYADGEASAEVYGAACDRNQASIVFDVAKQMTQMSAPLMKRSKIMAATKRIVNYTNAGFYQVLSAETGTKHGLNVSGLVFDEIHAQPNRRLYDVLTKGSGDAREQPLFFIITTAGNDKNSICYELHTKAKDIINGRKADSTFYPVVYGLDETDDWNDEKNWYKANPSLGHTIEIDRVRKAYRNALENPAEENVFKQLRLNMWVSSTVCWIPDHIFAKGNAPIDLESLKGRECYGGLDLSSTSDITALVLIFPPRYEGDNYIVYPHFWLPEDTLELRCRRDHVLYDVWKKQGYINTTEGNVIHYGFIEKYIENLGKLYNIKEIAVDRWNATQMIQNLSDLGFTMVPFGQGYKDMSPPSKELYKLMLEGKIQHGGNPVLRWMAQNVVIETDPAENIKPTKAKSIEKIDGIVAMIMALDRCIRNAKAENSVYDNRGILVF